MSAREKVKCGGFGGKTQTQPKNLKNLGGFGFWVLREDRALKTGLLLLLQIPPATLSQDEQRGAALEEEIWKMRGSPRKRDALLAAMEEMIEECKKRDLRFGRAFYLQYNRLKRKEWEPDQTIAATPIEQPHRTEEQIIEHARATLPPEEFERFQNLRRQAQELAGPKRSSVIEMRRKTHG